MKEALVYNPKSAWLRASVYFVVCLLIGWWTGALQAVFKTPLVTPKNLATAGFIPLTIACFAVILVGYGYIWPKGTLTHGRSLNLLSVIPFGLLWGVSEGVLFVSVWLILARWITTNWLLVLVTFLVLSTFKGMWHALYWDIYVSPEHNIDEWNIRKVLFAHVPNLLFTLTHLTLYHSAGLFVIWQVMALMLSTYFMRFPPFWETKESMGTNS